MNSIYQNVRNMFYTQWGVSEREAHAFAAWMPMLLDTAYPIQIWRVGLLTHFRAKDLAQNMSTLLRNKIFLVEFIQPKISVFSKDVQMVISNTIVGNRVKPNLLGVDTNHIVYIVGGLDPKFLKDFFPSNYISCINECMN